MSEWLNDIVCKQRRTGTWKWKMARLKSTQAVRGTSFPQVLELTPGTQGSHAASGSSRELGCCAEAVEAYKQAALLHGLR